MPIDKFYTFCYTIQAALATSNDTFIYFRFLWTRNFNFFFDIFQNSHNKLDNSDD